MKISLKNYTLRYLTLAFLLILIIWTLMVGIYIYEEVIYEEESYSKELLDDDVLLNLAIALGVLYAVLVLSTYLINLLLIRKIWRPFQAIITAIRQYKVGNRQQLQPITTDVMEFNILHQNIQQMWLRNEVMFDEQKAFIENASHELQTPLAITLGKLELLMTDEGLSEGQLLQLSQIKQSLTRMTHLNKSLLMLTRIENHQYKETESVSFQGLITAILDDLTDLIEYKELRVEVDALQDFRVEMNKDLAAILISNLVRNAIKYNFKGGEIKVVIRGDRFEVQNSSQDHLPLDVERIFKRFHKGEQDANSTGLGLAIVKSIGDAYQLDVSYRFKEGRHCLEVRGKR